MPENPRPWCFLRQPHLLSHSPRKISAVSIAAIGLYPKLPENFSGIDRKNTPSVCADIIGM